MNPCAHCAAKAKKSLKQKHHVSMRIFVVSIARWRRNRAFSCVS
ncbi:MAG: hypothetical protein EXS51_04430 [Candidatus Taylorbacteria bacterium]|nr:hypothetical protein [Candidatus Taylorbacteria bacterium]